MVSGFGMNVISVIQSPWFIAE